MPGCRVTKSVLLFASFALACVAAPFGAASAAAEFTALVELVEGDVQGVELLSFLPEGAALSLPAGARLVLAYLRTCTEETIDGGRAGGRIEIGAEQSKVDGVGVLRATVECDGGRLQLTPAQLKASAVAAMRDTKKPGLVAALHSTSPLILLAGSGRLTIQRTDAPGDPIEFTVEGAPGKTASVDLARRKVALTPGASYRVSAGDRARLVTLVPDARPGPAPAISRLLRLD